MWNDTDIPRAYLITFRCYGTWLHGDERGSIDRFHNQYEAPFAESNKNRKNYNASLLKHKPVKLNVAQRQAVEEAIREVCNRRNWSLYAINVRTNHVHTVVSTAGIKSTRALNDFKSYSTRKMREKNCWNYTHSLGQIKEAAGVYGTNEVSK